MAATSELLQTPLFNLHVDHGGRMVDFAGYAMPVQFSGIMSEHEYTRKNAGLFDVSHMGHFTLSSPKYELIAEVMEALTPGNFRSLAPGKQRYSLFLNQEGGIIDDFMAFRVADEKTPVLHVIVNASRKSIDKGLLQKHLPDSVQFFEQKERVLIALQGPKAADILRNGSPHINSMLFMEAAELSLFGVPCFVTRSGYTGEDGFEISIPAKQAESLVQKILDFETVKPIGLGARDSLRLEAGLPLYGSDIDETTSPVEAGLGFALAKKRLVLGGFPGAERLRHEWENAPQRQRVGLQIKERMPARSGAKIISHSTETGIITSGVFSPSLKHPIALGYVKNKDAIPGQNLEIEVRDKIIQAQVVTLPFVPHQYRRKK